jgi:hypothetical protein
MKFQHVISAILFLLGTTIGLFVHPVGGLACILVGSIFWYWGSSFDPAE